MPPLSSSLGENAQAMSHPTTPQKKKLISKYAHMAVIIYNNSSSGWGVHIVYCPVWGGRTHRLHLCNGVRPPPPNECPVYDTKQSDDEVPVMLEFWECGAPLHCHCSQVHCSPEW